MKSRCFGARTIAALLSVISLLALSMQCTSRATPEEQAREGARAAAEIYYSFLLRGDYQQFLDGRAGADTLPQGYREQLLVAYKHFMAQQRQAHGGITQAEATRANIDSTLQLVQVFLLLNYADSTQEEIVVPMVEYNGEWRMK